MRRQLTARAALAFVLIGPWARDGLGQAHEEMTKVERTAVIRSLKWHYKWKIAVEEEPAFVTCRGKRFSDGERMVFCFPRPVQVILAPQAGCAGLNVKAVLSASENIGSAMALHEGLKKNLGYSVLSEIHTEIPSATVMNYEPDDEASARFMRGVQSWARTLPGIYTGSSVTLLFPRVSEDDPFYDVYALVDGELSAIHQMKVDCGKVADFPEWRYDIPHKSLPKGSRSRANNKSLWYRSVQIQQADE